MFDAKRIKLLETKLSNTVMHVQKIWKHRFDALENRMDRIEKQFKLHQKSNEYKWREQGQRLNLLDQCNAEGIKKAKAKNESQEVEAAREAEQSASE